MAFTCSYFQGSCLECMGRNDRADYADIVRAMKVCMIEYSLAVRCESVSACDVTVLGVDWITKNQRDCLRIM